MLEIEIENLTEACLVAYQTVPIVFTMRSRLDVAELERSTFVEIPMSAQEKDYDAYAAECPTNLPRRFDTTNWRMLLAFRNDRHVGGAILAVRSPEFDLLRGRHDLAVMVDLRVEPETHRSGVGAAIFRAAVDWAKAEGCIELNVETQDTNVSACRFYYAMGCRLKSAEYGAYGPDSDEAKLIWSLNLTNVAL